MSNVVVVNSSASLLAALKIATVGETIELAPGEYDGVNISNENYSSNVTITSESSIGPSYLSGLTVSNSSDLTFSGVQISAAFSKSVYSAARVVLVDNLTELNAALANTTAGETIELAAGDYANVRVLNKAFASGITITSEDTSAPAVIQGITISGAQNVNITNVDLTTVGETVTGGYAFRVQASSNISFNNVTAVGDPKLSTAQNASAFLFQNSTAVSVTNSQLSDFNIGLTAIGNTGVNFSNNTLTAVKGGIALTSDLNVTNSNNSVTTSTTSTTSTTTTQSSGSTTSGVSGTTKTGAHVVVVNNVTELNTALANATAGETIELAAGDYANVRVLNKTFASGVTITSENDSAPAVIEGITISGAANVNINNVELSTVGETIEGGYAFRVQSSSNISFSNVDVEGDPTLSPSQNVSGLLFEKNTGISVTNSVISNFFAGITADNNSNVNFANNSFTLMDKGGIEMGDGQNVTISNNNFTDFETALGVHGDAIQLYSAGQLAASSNVVIDNNLFYRGTGNEAQGIFVQDEQGDMPVDNIQIDNNAMIGANWNSIYLDHAVGNVQIENNSVGSWSGYDAGTGGTTNFVGWIRTIGLNSASVTETGNHSQLYLSGQSQIATPLGNSSAGAITDNGLSMLKAWAAANPADISLLSSSLLTPLGQSGVTSGVGIL